MAQIPIYNSRVKTTTTERRLATPGPEQEPSMAAIGGENLARVGEATSQLGSKVENVANYFSELQDKTEKNKANVEAYKKIKDVQMRAANNPDPKAAIEQSKKELDAIGQSIAPSIKNSVVREQFLSDLEMDKASASFQIDNHAMQRIVQENKLSLDMRLEDLKDKWHGAPTAQEKELIAEQMKKELFSSVPQGTYTARGAELKFKSLKSELHTERANHALVVALNSPNPTELLKQEMENIQKDPVMSQAEKDKYALEFNSQMKKAEATEDVRQRMMYSDTMDALGEMIRSGDEEGARKIIEEARKNDEEKDPSKRSKSAFTFKRTKNTPANMNIEKAVKKAFSTPQVTDQIYSSEYNKMWNKLGDRFYPVNPDEFMVEALNMYSDGKLTPLGLKSLLYAHRVPAEGDKGFNRSIMNIETAMAYRETTDAKQMDRQRKIRSMIDQIKMIVGSDPKAMSTVIDKTASDWMRKNGNGSIDETAAKNAKDYMAGEEAVRKEAGADASFSAKNDWYIPTSVGPIKTSTVPESNAGKKKDKEELSKYKLNDIVTGKNGKKYVVIGFYPDGEAMIDPVEK